MTALRDGQTDRRMVVTVQYRVIWMSGFQMQSGAVVRERKGAMSYRITSYRIMSYLTLLCLS